MPKTLHAIGPSLRQLRERFNVPQPLLAAKAGSTTLYLGKVEAGLIMPSKSYVRKVTEAAILLSQDPPRPCPILGCDNTLHVDQLEGAPGDPKDHRADFEAHGDDWMIEVRRYDDQDTEWVVYVNIDDGYALTPASFLAVTDAYKQASAFASVLNMRGAVVSE